MSLDVEPDLKPQNARKSREPADDISDLEEPEKVKPTGKFKRAVDKFDTEYGNPINLVNVLLDSNVESGEDEIKVYTLRENLWNLLEHPASSNAARWVAIYIMTLIFLSCICFMMETDLTFHKKKIVFFEVMEGVCVIQFTIEYFVRLIVSPSKSKFLWSFLNTIDLVAILPWWFTVIQLNAGNTAFLRVIRLARVFRILKISRYVSWIIVFVNSLTKSAKPLAMLLYVIMLAMVFFGATMYFIERGEWDLEEKVYYRTHPYTGERKISPFQSIPESFWWCIITMTTCGYGDFVPWSWLGKFVAAVTSLCGILVFAIPITVISKTFDRELDEMKNLQNLGIVEIRTLKAKLLQLYQKRKLECDIMKDRKEIKKEKQKRKGVMVDLVRYLRKETKNFDWGSTSALSPEDVRCVLSYYVANKISFCIRQADDQLEEKIHTAITQHKEIVEEEIRKVLEELPDRKSVDSFKELEIQMKNERKIQKSS